MLSPFLKVSLEPFQRLAGSKGRSPLFRLLFLFILLRADAGEEFFFFAVGDGEAVEPDALNVVSPGEEGFVHVEDVLFDVVSAQAEQELSVLGALEAGNFFTRAVGYDALRLHGAFAEGAEGEADARIGAELLEIDHAPDLFKGEDVGIGELADGSLILRNALRCVYFARDQGGYLGVASGVVKVDVLGVDAELFGGALEGYAVFGADLSHVDRLEIIIFRRPLRK